ncbi:MAG: hypothetical protein Q4G68_03560 [Planctomycetia bacterium]|nr:hypothetical protein [Planctomycetia bacterium]
MTIGILPLSFILAHSSFATTAGRLRDFGTHYYYRTLHYHIKKVTLRKPPKFKFYLFPAIFRLFRGKKGFFPLKGVGNFNGLLDFSAVSVRMKRLE